MPNYDFKCADCKCSFEQIVPCDHRNRRIECVKCGGKARREQNFSTFGTFKPFMTDDPLTGKEVKMNSLGQYEKFRRHHGLVSPGYDNLRGSQEHDGKLNEEKDEDAAWDKSWADARKTVSNQSKITVNSRG